MTPGQRCPDLSFRKSARSGLDALWIRHRAILELNHAKGVGMSRVVNA